ncbi:hypothetical protein SAMN06295974_3802 [Plantibacter flavus]|uniref:hypothetical protein n=1 Tax=Plantibacter flavus TaxID=150123 RepID=UPI000A0B3875|nr:hypothetical protein [Plantibacter flavus]SMG48987.1 hypothetical protein SAMN06295974_3802 [Plantibacter flavus]
MDQNKNISRQTNDRMIQELRAATPVLGSSVAALLATRRKIGESLFLIGLHGGRAAILGPTPSAPSGSKMTLETEFGPVKYRADDVLLIATSHGGLDAVEKTDSDLWVSWTITDESTDTSPVDVVRGVWMNVFGRNSVGPDDACVFDVTDISKGRSVRVDLSDFGLDD